MPINQLHGTLQHLFLQLRPGERVTRVRNWSLLLVGLCLSKSVHLSKIANKIPTKATLPSATRRLSRLLDNVAIRVRDWYEPIARSLLEQAAQGGGGGGGEIRLIVDGSKVGSDHQLLMVSLAYRCRAIPIASTSGLKPWSCLGPDVLEAAGAKYLSRGGAHKVYEGDWEPRRIVILEFPSVAAWEQFYTGPVYQGLKSVRDQCSSARLVSVEGT